MAHWKDFEKGYNKLNFYSLTKENFLNLCPFEKLEHNLPKKCYHQSNINLEGQMPSY